MRSAVSVLALLLLSACVGRRWVHPTKSDAEVQTGCERCKAEVSAGQEHRKDMMVGGINLSG